MLSGIIAIFAIDRCPGARTTGPERSRLRWAWFALPVGVALFALFAPQFSVSQFEKAYNAAADGDHEAAIEYYTLAIDSGDLSERDLAMAHNNRGDVYRKIHEYDEVLYNFKLVINLDSLDSEKKAWPFYNRGLAYADQGKYDQAIADFDRAIEFNPDYTIAFVNRGEAYRQTGEYDRSIADYDQAIRLDPDKVIAVNNKAWVLATARKSYIRDGQEAVRLAQEAVRLNDNPGFRDTLAAAYAEAGQFADAVAEQERVIEMAQAAGFEHHLTEFQSRLDLYRRRQPYRE